MSKSDSKKIENERTSSLTGEFLDPDLEKRFLNVYRVQHTRQIRIVLILSFVAFLFALYQNYIDLGDTEYFSWIVYPRLFSLIFFIWVIYKCYDKSLSNDFQITAFLAEVFTGVAETLETLAYHEAPGFEINLISAPFLFTLVLGFYIFIHIRWILTTIASLIGGGLLIAAYMYMANDQLESIIRHPIMLFAFIIIGATVVKGMNQIQRKSWLQSQKIENEIIERRLAEQKALEASRVKGEFLAVMSHEIRTPLNSILAMADILSEEQDLKNERNQRQLNILDTAGKHLNDLIEDILDFSSIEAQARPVISEPFNLADTIEQTRLSIQNLANKKGLELNLHIDESTPEFVLGDAKSIRQILINLIGNAIKFTHTGSINIHVSRADTQENGIYFSVSDTGIGIPENDLHRIFEPFQQSDSSSTRKYQGAGLGLAITQKLVQHMGGTISVKNSSSGGTIFDFTLALLESDEINTPINKSASSTQIVPPQGHFRALVVEDSELNCLVIEEYLADADCELRFTNNGRQAIQDFKLEEFDIIFMDMQMPEMDGATTTQIIRNWENENHKEPTPIIIVTADSLIETRQLAFQSGADEYLTKPMSRYDLFNVLNHYIQKDNPLAEKPQTQTQTKNNEDKIDDSNVLNGLLPKFFDQMHQDIKMMYQTIENKDIKQLAILAHTVKGHCQIFKFHQLSTAAEKLQEKARSSHSTVAELEITLKELCDIFDVVILQHNKVE